MRSIVDVKLNKRLLTIYQMFKERFLLCLSSFIVNKKDFKLFVIVVLYDVINNVESIKRKKQLKIIDVYDFYL